MMSLMHVSPVSVLLLYLLIKDPASGRAQQQRTPQAVEVADPCFGKGSNLTEIL